MNKRQRVALWVGMGLTVLMGFFPPWIEVTSADGMLIVAAERPIGYYPLVVPPKYQGLGFKVDTTRLVIQFVLVGIVTGGAILSLKTPRRAGQTPAERQVGR